MSSNHTQKLRQAAKLTKRREFETAQKLIMQVLKENPKNVTAWWGIAKLSKSPIDRRMALNTVLQLNPDRERAHDMLTKLDEQYPPNDEDIDFEERSLEFPVPKAPPTPSPLNPLPTKPSTPPWHHQQTQFSAPTPHQQAPYLPPQYYFHNAPWNSYPYHPQQPLQSKPKRKHLIIAAILIFIPAIIMLLVAMSDQWTVSNTENVLVLLVARVVGTLAAIHIGQSILSDISSNSSNQNVYRGGSAVVQLGTTLGAAVIMLLSISGGINVIDKTETVSPHSEIVGVWQSIGGAFGPSTLDFQPNGKLYGTNPFGTVYEYDYYVVGDQLTLIDNPGTENESEFTYSVRELDRSSLILWSSRGGLESFVRIG